MDMIQTYTDSAQTNLKMQVICFVCPQEQNMPLLHQSLYCCQKSFSWVSNRSGNLVTAHLGPKRPAQLVTCKNPPHYLRTRPVFCAKTVGWVPGDISSPGGPWFRYTTEYYRVEWLEPQELLFLRAKIIQLPLSSTRLQRGPGKTREDQDFFFCPRPNHTCIECVPA